MPPRIIVLEYSEFNLESDEELKPAEVLAIEQALEKLNELCEKELIIIYARRHQKRPKVSEDEKGQ